jgi:hypothetical protein
MKRLLAATMISALALTGSVSAGMQGQGAHPDENKPEHEEENSGGYSQMVIERAILPATFKSTT